MQRKRVDLPAPDGPMMAMTAPRSTVSDTPFNTSTAPKDFHRSLISIIGRRSAALGIVSLSRRGRASVRPLGGQGQRKQHEEIEHRDHRINLERTVRLSR